MYKIPHESHRDDISDSNACIRYPMSPIGTTFQIAWGDHIQSKLPSLQDSFGASKHGFLSKLPSRWDSKRPYFTSSEASDTAMCDCLIVIAWMPDHYTINSLLCSYVSKKVKTSRRPIVINPKLIWRGYDFGDPCINPFLSFFIGLCQQPVLVNIHER